MPRLRRLDPVWFRLLVRVPLRVEFSTATFELEIQQVQFGGWQWNLFGNHHAAASVVVISEDFAEREWLEEAMYVTGFAARHITVGELIMLRMVREGRAVRLDTPLRPPEHRRGMPWAWYGIRSQN